MFIFTNLAMSIDAKIAFPDSGAIPLGTPYDRKHMVTLRKRSHAILMGAESLRVYKKPCTIPKQRKQPVNFILSTNLKSVSPNWPFFKNKNISRVLFINKKLERKKEELFSATSKIVYLEKSKSVAQQITSYSKNNNIEALLVEGGGRIMWEFIKENLIDELNLTMTPKIIAGESAPDLVTGSGFKSTSYRKMKLIKVRRVKEEIYLTYQKIKGH